MSLCSYAVIDVIGMLTRLFLFFSFFSFYLRGFVLVLFGQDVLDLTEAEIPDTRCASGSAARLDDQDAQEVYFERSCAVEEA